MRMETDKLSYPTWTSCSEITSPKGMTIFYKYIVYDRNTNNYFWEFLPNNSNRKFVALQAGITIVRDQKGTLESTSENKLSSNELERDNDDIIPLEYRRSHSFIQKSLDLSSLGYDSNLLNGNDMNETLLFCISQKMTTEDRIIICTAHLPFEVEITNEGKPSIKVQEDNLIYSILYKMKESDFCEVVWIGMLKNYLSFTESELEMITIYLENKGIFIIRASETDYKNYWKYINNILTPIFVENSIDLENCHFLNYEDYFLSYKLINQKFAYSIYSHLEENDLIMLNDVHLMLVPNTLLTKNANARVGIYFHIAFPSSDVLGSIPFHQEILNSILLCDLVGFHIFQFARNFLASCKRIMGLFYEIKFRGFFTLNFMGRTIIVRIMHAGIDYDYIKSVLNKEEFMLVAPDIKKYTKDKFSFVSVDRSIYSSGLLMKLEAFDRFLKKNVFLRKQVILIQVIKYDTNDPPDSDFEKDLNQKIKEIEADHGENSIIILKVKEFSVAQRFALFSEGDALYYLQVRDGNCMYVNEYIALQNIMCKAEGKIKFGIIISENIGVTSAIKGCSRVNPYNINHILQALERVYFMKYEEREGLFYKDLEPVKLNTFFSWVKNFFVDLKRTSSNQTGTKIGIGIGLNFRLMKLNSNFQHLNIKEVLDAYKKSNRRIFFLDYEGTLLSVSDEFEKKSDDYYLPSERLKKILACLCADPKNLVYIVSSREKKYLSQWFGTIPNLNLAAEHGFYYKENDNDWQVLFSLKDWSWKTTVLNILQGFTEKTEGSYIVEKEAIISWYYRDCEFLFGHLQASEISTHLQIIFENSKLDVVHGTGHVEIKPKNVNKGYFASEIIKNEYVTRGQIPDFIIALGDGDNDEDTFNYLNSVQNQLCFYNENSKQFTCTIGRKPSNAKFYLNEVQEAIDMLEQLQMSNNNEKMRIKFSDEKKKKGMSTVQQDVRSEKVGRSHTLTGTWKKLSSKNLASPNL